jgi:hypothetical protein
VTVEHTRDPATLELLRDRATTDTNEDVRQAALQALASGWRHDPAIPASLLERADPARRSGRQVCCGYYQLKR